MTSIYSPWFKTNQNKHMLIAALNSIGGLLLLFVGGEILIRGAVSMAKALGLSPFVIGLTVVAYGTSSPELLISVQAALSGHAEIAFGNVIGSNLSNTLCIFGVTALISPIAIDKKLSLLDGLVMFAVTLLLFGLAFLGEVGRLTSIVFLSILVVYTIAVFRTAKRKKDIIPVEQTEEIEEQIQVNLGFWQSIFATAGGFALLIFGADKLITGATSIATSIGISEAVIGLTLVAFGGSVPELVTSVVAALHKRSEIVFGNIIGSNLFNILGVLGVTGAVAPIPIKHDFIAIDLPFLLAITIIIIAVMIFLPRINRLLGALLLSTYVGYVAILLA